MAEPQIEPVIETSVDELIRLLQKQEKLTMQDAAKALKVPVDIVQSWVDFLVEEKILGIEYKFTVPYIYLNVQPTVEAPAPVAQPKMTLADFKREFQVKAESTLPQSKGRVLVMNLWKQHLSAELERKKSWFLSEVRKRNLDNPDQVWAVYQKRMMDA